MRMCEPDILETARFVREFVTMSLLPWMEKCVVDWKVAGAESGLERQDFIGEPAATVFA